VKRLAAVYSGSAAQHRALNEPKYRRWLTQLIYLPELADTDLESFDGLLVTERLHRGKLDAASARVRAFLERGRTVIFLIGDEPPSWLPGVRWEDRFRSEQGNWMPTWFVTPGDGLGLRAARPEHPFFRHVPLENATWHHHGVFWPPKGAEPLIVTRDGAAVLYIDRVTTPGTLLVTSLDPIYHFGSYFMPACERFLDGFLPWALQELLTDDNKKGDG